MENRSFHQSTLARLLIAVAAVTGFALIWSQLNSKMPSPTVAEEANSRVPDVPTENSVRSPAAAYSTAAHPVAPTLTPEQLSIQSAAAQRDEELKTQLIGIWYHSENGDQWIENRPDGTSRMLLKLNFISSLLYGQETSMELTWAVKDGILTNTIVSGLPKKNVDSLVKDFSQARQYTILETTPERMLIESRSKKDEKKKELWTRSPAPKEWAVMEPLPEAAVPGQ